MSAIRALPLFALIFLVGCAHPIVTTPNMSDLSAKDFRKSDKVVGYYISTEDRERRVTTPGGGGDKISYQPYKDLEPGLQKILSNAFTDVITLSSRDDKAAVQKHNIAFIFTPYITTNSSSDSAFTWPPTKFTVSLACEAVDRNGKTVFQTKTEQEGNASFSEFKHDFPLAAKRAMAQALLELQKQLAAAPALR